MTKFSTHGLGQFWLQDSRIASMVADAILYGEQVPKLYTLYAWVIMPNHVHIILQPHCELPTIMHWLKGRTARVANRILERSGTPFWQDEVFDHWVRAEELSYLVEYVENNPVKAGLVVWPWSSAYYSRNSAIVAPEPPSCWGAG
jgi:REP element-mobilizing transposase RayT